MVDAFVATLRNFVAAATDDLVTIKDVIHDLSDALAADDADKAEDVLHDLESRIATLSAAIANLADIIPPADAPTSG